MTIVSAGARTEAGKARLTLIVEQSAPAYIMRLPVEIVFSTSSEMRSIEIGRRRNVVAVDVDAVPAGVRLDPDLRIWRVLEREQLPPILRQWVIARAPRLVQASGAEGVRDAAVALAKRFFEIPPQSTSQGALNQGTEPVMMMGLHADVDAALAHAGLPPRPVSLSGRGTAQVWTIAREDGPPVAVASAMDADALRALVGPLPHYGAQSWLVFDGRRVLDRGVWPAPGRLIAVQNDR